MNPDRRLLCITALLGLTVACGQEKQAGPSGPPPEVVERWAGFSACVVGGKPLENETPSARMRAIELTALAQGEASWPKDCVELGAKTVAALQEVEPKVEALEALRKQMVLLSGPDLFLSQDDGILVDKIWELAAAAGLDPAPHVPEGSPRALPPSPSAPPSARIALGSTPALLDRHERSPDLGSRRVVWGGGDVPALACRFTSAQAPLDTVTCAAPEGRSGRFVPLSSEATDATYLFDAEPEPTVTGGRLSEPVSFSGSADTFVFADGSLGEVVKDGAQAQLLRRRPDGKLLKAPLRGPAGGIFLDFAGTAVTWIGPLRGTGRRPLSMQSMGTGRAVMTADREVGEVPPGVEHVLTCRRGGDVTVALVGPKVADDGHVEVAMTHRNDGKWTKPVAGQAMLGPKAEGEDLPQPRIACHGDGSASLVWRTQDDRVGSVRCGEACTAAISEPIPPVGKASHPAVALVGDEAVLVRTTRILSPMTGVTDAVLIRRGKVADLAKVPDRVLVGDEDHGGLKGLTRGLDLIATDGAAVVLVRGEDEVYGVRVTVDGKTGGLTRTPQ